MSYALLAFGYMALGAATLLSMQTIYQSGSDPIPCVMGSSAACEERADCRPEFGDRDCPGCECDMETHQCRPL